MALPVGLFFLICIVMCLFADWSKRWGRRGSVRADAAATTREPDAPAGDWQWPIRGRAA